MDRSKVSLQLQYLSELRAANEGAHTRYERDELAKRMRRVCESIEQELNIGQENQCQTALNDSLVFPIPKEEDGKLLFLLNGDGLSKNEFAELRDIVDKFLKATKFSKTKVRMRRDLRDWNRNELFGPGNVLTIIDEQRDHRG